MPESTTPDPTTSESTPSAPRVPHAMWRVMLDKRDLTDTIAPRLISLSLTEKRGKEADELEITLDNRDGLLALPKKGAVLKVELGWAQGDGLPIGLIDKGNYKVDERSMSGPPDIITLRARSANMTDALVKRRDRHFVNKTVAHIITTIANDNGLKAAIEAGLAAKTVPALGHGAKSDAALLTALGKRFDAMATIKAGILIFAPLGAGKTAKGTTIPTETIDRRVAPNFTYDDNDRHSYGAVEAVWHNKASAQRHTIKVGSGKTKRLRKTYATEADARHAAEAEAAKHGRGKAHFETTLPIGRPDLTPDRPITLINYNPTTDALKWVIVESNHTMNGTGGLVTKINLESRS